jgi:hypothetical protein
VASATWLCCCLQPNRDVRRQAAGVVVDIELLAGAAGFVGTLTSALSRTALQLAAHRRGAVPPYISLDIPWCWGGFHTVPVPWGFYGC